MCVCACVGTRACRVCVCGCVCVCLHSTVVQWVELNTPQTKLINIILHHTFDAHHSLIKFHNLLSGQTYASARSKNLNRSVCKKGRYQVAHGTVTKFSVKSIGDER